ncbi:class I SAM-dependent methyltransferase [Roseivirga sp.]|uniref:class I SAM-dependent methyltransferase n=1 Tax=Roseivirga sp. TaxID=1964215 RepID=UPI003B8B94EE
MKNDFDLVAPFYDRMARLVFGHQLERAQQCFLSQLPEGARLLIAGGGRGRVLRWLPTDKALKITYVDLSKQMIKAAKQQIYDNLDVEFIAKDVRDIDGQYDVVVANFFFDCFERDGLNEVLAKLKELMPLHGQLIVTDFGIPMNFKQRLLLKAMHLFFGLAANLEAKALQDIRCVIGESGFDLKCEEHFSNQLIFSALFQKSNEQSL